MDKRRATDGYVATRFVELRVSSVSLTSRTKITILLSRSFFFFVIKYLVDGKMSPTTAQVIHNAILFPVSHTSCTKAP